MPSAHKSLSLVESLFKTYGAKYKGVPAIAVDFGSTLSDLTSPKSINLKYPFAISIIF
jgi:hypothetical protein